MHTSTEGDSKRGQLRFLSKYEVSGMFFFSDSTNSRYGHVTELSDLYLPKKDEVKAAVIVGQEP